MTTIVFPVSRIRSTFWRRTALVALAPLALLLMLLGLLINLILAPVTVVLEFLIAVVEAIESAARVWRAKG